MFDLTTILISTTGFLLAGNLFFIKRLIDKIEFAGISNSRNSGELGKLGRDINAIGSQLRELRVDVKDLRRIELDVAVLKSQQAPTDKKA